MSFLSPIPREPSTYTTDQYFKFLLNFKEVCQEVGIEPSTQLTSAATNLRGLKTLEQSPTNTFRQIIQKTESLQGDPLFFYEAARRINIKAFKTYFLNVWKINTGEQIKAGLRKDIKSLSHKQLSTEDRNLSIDEKIQVFINQMSWPNFKDKNSAEVEMSSLPFLLFEEIVYRKFHPKSSDVHPPPYLKLLLDDKPLTSLEEHLIDRHSHRFKKITINNHTDNQIVELYLSRFPKMEKLNLTGCKFLTPSCLSKGHPNLTEITLTNTGLNSSAIKPKLFPRLVYIEKNDSSSSSDSFSKHAPWSAIKNLCNTPDFLLKKQFHPDFLLDKFSKSPSPEGLEIILDFYRLLKEQPSSKSNILSFEQRLLNLLMIEWKLTTEEDLKKPESLGIKILLFLRTQWNLLEGSTPLAKLVDEVIFTEISVKNCLYLNADAMVRIRTLLYYTPHHKKPYLLKIAALISENILKLRAIIFHKNDGSPIEEIHSRQEVLKLEFLNELYVEISHITPLSDPGPFQELKDPNKETKTIPTGSYNPVIQAVFNMPKPNSPALPGEPYRHLTPQTLASAFMLQLENGEREKMLTYVLQNFKEYAPISPYYPLAKILLGVVKESDIPPWDQKSDLPKHLLIYKGIFQEEGLSDQLKNQFWKALKRGRLGGPTESLKQALSDFSLKKEISESWKKKIDKILANLTRTQNTPSNPESPSSSSNPDSMLFPLRQLTAK